LPFYDRDDRLVVFNGHYRDMYSQCADIIRPGMPYAALLRVGAERGLFPEAEGRAEAWVAEVLEQHRGSAMTVERRLSGDRWIKISERRTRDGGHVGVRTDITDLKAREATLRAARDAAETASRAKSEFLAMVSHELRTPLNAIIGFSEIMESEIMGPIGNDSYLAYAGDIHDSGEHLLSIINDILDLVKAESGKLALNEEEVDIGAVFDLCRKLVLRRAEDGNVTLDSRLPNPCPALWGDPRALKQILLNLLTNAIKFTQPGGQVTVEARREESGGLSFVVADTGIGMTDEHDIGFYAKRARASELTFGDAAYHRQRFAELSGF